MGSKIRFSLISNAQSMMHRLGGMVARRKNFTDELWSRTDVC